MRSDRRVGVVWLVFAALAVGIEFLPFPLLLSTQAAEPKDDPKLLRFVQAIERNDTNTVRMMLESDPGLVRTFYYTALPLHVAASRGSLETADLLLKNGADIDAAADTLETSNNQITALDVAIWYGHPAICKRLLEAGANPNHVSPLHGTALHFALHFHREEMAGWLLDHGADPFLTESQTYRRTTPFELAILEGDGRFVSRMLNPASGSSAPARRGAEVLKEGNPALHPAAARFLAAQGVSLLAAAAQRGEVEAVQALFKAGVSLPQTSAEHRSLLRTVALSAAEAAKSPSPAFDRWSEVRGLLVQHGLDYDAFAATGFGDLETVRNLWSKNERLARAADEDGYTPLHWAVRADRLPLTAFWLEVGADAAATNRTGQTALHLAAASGLAKQVIRLLAARAPTAGRDTNGWTPLEAAIQARQTDTIRLLLPEKTAGPPSERGVTTPLHEAAARGNIAALASLVTSTNIESRNELGLAPLHLTVQRGHLAAAALLVDKGANANARDPEGNTTLHLIMLRAPPVILDRPPASWLARMEANPRLEAFLRYVDTPDSAQQARPLLVAAGFLLACGADAVATNHAGQSVVQLALRDSAMLFEDDRTKLLQMLGAKGGNVDETDPMGDSALHRAARELFGGKAAELIAAGASLEATNHQGRTPLHASVEHINGWGAQPIEEILKAKPNVNAQDREGLTALHVLARSRSSYRKEATQVLLAAGANPNLPDNQGRTPMHLFLTGEWPWSGSADCVALLAKAGGDHAARDLNGQTPLHYLAALGGPSQAFLLRGLTNLIVASKLDLEIKDENGDAPLHIAARAGTSDVFNYLLASGADLDARNTAGETPRLLAARQSNPRARFDRRSDTDIFQAARAGNIEGIRALVMADRKLLNMTNQIGETPLRVAVFAHRTNVVEFLDASGAQWDALSAVMAGRTNVLAGILSQTPFAVTNTHYGRTLLQLAAVRGDVSMLRMLLQAGADVRAQDWQGVSPLGTALLQQETEAAALLRQHGAAENAFDAVYAGDVETLASMLASDKSTARARNREGCSLAEAATANGRVEILNLLLRNGAKPELPNERDGRTLLHFAAIYNQTNTAELLLHLGAKLDTPDRWGFTPLHLAAVEGSMEAAALLLRHKAGVNKAVVFPGGAPTYETRRYSTLAGSSALHLAALNGHTNVLTLLLKSGASINATNASGRTALDLASGPAASSVQPTAGLTRRGQLFLATPPGASTNPIDALSGGRLAAAELLKSMGGQHSTSYRPRHFPF